MPKHSSQLVSEWKTISGVVHDRKCSGGLLLFISWECTQAQHDHGNVQSHRIFAGTLDWLRWGVVRDGGRGREGGNL